MRLQLAVMSFSTLCEKLIFSILLKTVRMSIEKNVRTLLYHLPLAVTRLPKQSLIVAL